MNISYKWLKRYIDFSLTPQELAAAFTSLGLECDTVTEVETVRGGLRGLVIGEVLTCVPHPDSDHLHITTVNLGAADPVQIVCGAPNVAAGQKVVVATLGAKLYDGDKELTIKKSKMRGVESLGMICAEDEIGLGSSHDGIMVLDAEALPGTPAAEYFNLQSDYMLEVELTPNRVDGASHFGCARDLKAWLHRHGHPEAELYTPSVADVTPDTPDGAIPVEVQDPQGCPRYSGITIRGVKVAESPDWLKELLTAAGQRPINNIVDITNFILLGMGQPLHCFDLAKVKGDKIVVRTCPAGTKFTTLDGVEHTLHEADLMICNAEEPMCIAGVFGGLDSGVKESTTDVFIESAYFNPTRVRRTARRHGLSTDASFRYERGTDPNITVYAARLAAKLITELAGGKICGEPQDVYPHPVKPFPVTLDCDYARRLIGKDIPTAEMEQILRSLDIRIVSRESETLQLEVPNYRVDVQRPCDVVEEILRVYGYNNVEISPEMHANLSIRTAVDESYEMQNRLSEQLTAEGYREILNNSLTSVSYYEENEIYPRSKAVELLNPLSSDLGLMRQTLLYGGLEVVAHNINRRNASLALYEFGNVYQRNPQSESTAERPLAPYSEEMHLALWLTGHTTLPTWCDPGREFTVFDLKATVLGLFQRLGISPNAILLTQGADALYSAALTIATRSGQTLGTLGILRPEVLQKFDIEQSVCYAELLWTPLMHLAAKGKVQYADLPRTQAVERDLALLLDQAVTFAQVEAVVRASEKKLLRDVRLFDVYEGKNLPAGKKSYAISLTLQDPDKTLQDRQIEATMKKIITNLQTRLGAQLR